MHQIIALFLVVGVAFLLNAPRAAALAADGLWGYAAGRLVFGPILSFFVVQTILYFIVRAIRGREGVARFSRSRLNYIAALIAVLGMVGSAANPV